MFVSNFYPYSYTNSKLAFEGNKKIDKKDLHKKVSRKKALDCIDEVLFSEKNIGEFGFNNMKRLQIQIKKAINNL